jgi:hypothetical protein
VEGPNIGDIISAFPLSDRDLGGVLVGRQRACIFGKHHAEMR